MTPVPKLQKSLTTQNNCLRQIKVKKPSRHSNHVQYLVIKAENVSRGYLLYKCQGHPKTNERNAFISTKAMCDTELEGTDLKMYPLKYTDSY